jgi:hypothetical protein
MENAKIIKPTPEQLENIKKWKESKESPLDRANRKYDEEQKKRLQLIIEKSKMGDVHYDLYRWFRTRMLKNDPELLEIQKNGYIAEAVRWIRSTITEKMNYGRFSKEQRIEEAKKYAELAGVPLEQILKEHNLKFPE